MCVHVGPGVLDLSGLDEDGWDDGVELTHQVEHFVVGQVLQGKLTLATVPGVSLTQDGVTVAGHHLA